MGKEALVSGFMVPPTLNLASHRVRLGEAADHLVPASFHISAGVSQRLL